MPDKLEKVQPGDLIEASLYNDLVERIRNLEERIDATPSDMVAVPDLIALQLGTAVDNLDQPNVNLERGLVLDVMGTTIDPSLGKNQSRLVVGQTPEPGRRVVTGTPVQLLIAAPASIKDGGETPPPKINPPPRGFSPASQNIGGKVAINGENLSGNSVSVEIDGESATILNEGDLALEVRVPESISEPPEGETRTVPVQVTVDGQSTTDDQNFSVKPKKQRETPAISGVDTTRFGENPNPGAAQPGTKIVILGENFVGDKSKITVTFDGQEATVNSATTNASSDDEIEVEVPDLSLSSTQTVDIIVDIDGASPSDPYTDLFYVV